VDISDTKGDKMSTIQPKEISTIVSNIQTDLADNNSGQIGAKEIRDNMLDIVSSIPYIVASGNFSSTDLSYKNHLKLQINSDNTDGGILIVTSGVRFDTPLGVGGLQTVPYPGPGGIDHNTLDNLNVGDEHTQYLHLDGLRNMSGPLGMEDNWISSSGLAMGASTTRGLKFEGVGTQEVVHVGSATSITFDSDSSNMPTAKGVAQAWISFSSVSGVNAAEANTVTVNNSYNISVVERVEENGQPQAGKFKIYFKPGLFDDNNYVAIGFSNASSSDATPESVDQNTVAIVDRTSSYLTFYVYNDTNVFVNAAENDLIVFGTPSGVTEDATPTVRIGPS
jgi:hypothetical protein